MNAFWKGLLITGAVVGVLLYNDLTYAEDGLAMDVNHGGDSSFAAATASYSPQSAINHGREKPQWRRITLYAGNTGIIWDEKSHSVGFPEFSDRVWLSQARVAYTRVAGIKTDLGNGSSFWVGRVSNASTNQAFNGVTVMIPF